jgi:hypothetical protein
MSDRRTLLTALLSMALLAGCGGASDSGVSTDSSPPTRSSPPPRPSLCHVGASALAAIPGAPTQWREGRRDPVVLGCLRSGSPNGVALVGFSAAQRSCVVSYVFQTREAFNERCAEPGASWTIQCEGRLGCTSAFVHEPHLTQLNGPVDARVKRVRVSVAGRPLARGVLFASVHGKLLRAMGAREPFGFFFVSIPRCVAPAAVRVELRGADGSDLGLAQPWDVIVEPCRGPAGEASPST